MINYACTIYINLSLFHNLKKVYRNIRIIKVGNIKILGYYQNIISVSKRYNYHIPIGSL